VEHLITFQPMVGMVDSEHVVFVGRDPEKIGEPTEGNEIERMEWVPLASLSSAVSGHMRSSWSGLAQVAALGWSANPENAWAHDLACRA